MRFRDITIRISKNQEVDQYGNENFQHQITVPVVKNSNIDFLLVAFPVHVVMGIILFPILESKKQYGTSIHQILSQLTNHFDLALLMLTSYKLQQKEKPYNFTNWLKKTVEFGERW